MVTFLWITDQRQVTDLVKYPVATDTTGPSVSESETGSRGAQSSTLSERDRYAHIYADTYHMANS